MRRRFDAVSDPTATPLANSGLFALVRLLQNLDVELLHFEKSIHHSLVSGVVFHPFTHDCGDDLPGEAVFVLEPAARPLLSTFGKLLPEIVDLFLGVAVQHERDRLAEFEDGTAVQGHELLAIELERYG